MSQSSPDGRGLRESIAATLRAHRAQLGLSQRDLADRAGLPQATVARIERGEYDCRLSWIVTALGAVGARLIVPDAAEPTRMAGEYARDQAGRRLPAHLEPYRLQRPHWWWEGHTQILMWPTEPKWSYRRVLSEPTARLLRVSERTARWLPAPRSEPC